MRRRRKTFIADLTPLLDVVFILLFLVMMVSTKSQAQRTQTAEEAAAAAIQEAQEAVREAEQAKAEAEDVKSQAQELERLLEGARVVTVSLRDDGEDARMFTVTSGAETAAYRFDWDSTEQARAFLSEALVRQAGGTKKNAPVFLIFRYDPAQIYESDYRMVAEVFAAVQKGFGNVYIQMREEDHE